MKIALARENRHFLMNQSLTMNTMTQLRDLENAHNEKVSDMCVVTLEKLMKNEMEEDLPDDLRMVSSTGKEIKHSQDSIFIHDSQVSNSVPKHIPTSLKGTVLFQSPYPIFKDPHPSVLCFEILRMDL